MTAQRSQDGGSKSVIAALAANLGIAVTKFGAAFYTGSSSMLAEGIHSLVDTANQGFLLLGISRSNLILKIQKYQLERPGTPDSDDDAEGAA